MLWRDPLALVALAVVPALVLFLVWAERRRRAALDAFVASALHPVVVPDVDPRRRRLRHGLLVAAAALLAVALAGPRWGFEWEEVRREGIDLVIALDTSRSMLATDVKPDRLGRAKLGVRDLVEAAHGDRLALIAFAGTAFLQCPLTLDHAAFLQSLDAVQVGIIPRGGTNLETAVATALDAFDGREGKHQALVLVTDGEKTEGDVQAAVTAAKARGVKVFTVGIGTPSGELIPVEGGGWAKDRKGQVVKSKLDESTLETLAVDTGGVYLHAQGPSLGLTDLYRDHLATLDERPLGSTLERRFEHRFQWPLAAALLLLVVEPLLGERRPAPRARRRRPWRQAAAAVVLAALSVGWLDPDATGREGNRLFAEGKFDEAAQKYNEALVDDPDSSRLHLNLGAARYKAQQWDDAATAFEQVPGDQPAEPRRTAAAHYNLGNTRVHQGDALEKGEPQKALQRWAEALVAYRRALGAQPDDEDAKFNHELVERKIAALRKRLEEQQQQQQEQQQQGDQQEQGGEQQQGEQRDEGGEQRQGDEQQRPGEQQQAQPQQGGEQGERDGQPQEAQDEGQQDQRQAGRPEQQPGDTQGDGHDEQPGEQPPSGMPQQAGNDARGGAEPPPGDAALAGGARDDGELSRQEAAALLDAQRQQEVQPGEVIRRLQRGVVAAPAEDW